MGRLEVTERRAGWRSDKIQGQARGQTKYRGCWRSNRIKEQAGTPDRIQGDARGQTEYRDRLVVRQNIGGRWR